MHSAIPHIRPLQQEDDPHLAALIRQVLLEMGVPKVGSAYADPCLDEMSGFYGSERRAYFVVEQAGRLLGGAGFAELAGDDSGICELQKMYFLPELRGQGMGEAMITKCLQQAKTMAYRAMYLETMPSMEAAQKLYRKMGFEYQCRPMGDTGHHACQTWMLKTL